MGCGSWMVGLVFHLQNAFSVDYVFMAIPGFYQPWAGIRNPVRIDLTLNHIHRKAAAGSFLVFGFHVPACVFHGFDDLVERHEMRTFAV